MKNNRHQYPFHLGAIVPKSEPAISQRKGRKTMKHYRFNLAASFKTFLYGYVVTLLAWMLFDSGIVAVIGFALCYLLAPLAGYLTRN